MPITQQRMIALIHAARDYQDALEKACHYVRTAAKNAKSDPTKATYELDNLALYVDTIGLLRDPLGSATRIVLEQSHFQKQAGKNAAAASRATEKRRSQGTRPSHRRIYDELSPRHMEHPVPWSSAPDTIQRVPQYADISADGIANSENEPMPSLVPPAARFLNAHGFPVKIIGDPNAPGLYDSDDEPEIALFPDSIEPCEVNLPSPDKQAEIDAEADKILAEDAAVKKRLEEMEDSPEIVHDKHGGLK